jgi:protoporphyrinogen oxidase
LTAAYELVKEGYRPLVFEKSDQVGGISRTETYKGYRFDIGGHRFFTKVGEVEAFWHEVMGDDFVEVVRLSRIYYGGKFYPYPLKLFDTLLNLGPLESAHILMSYLRAKIDPYPEENNFKQWVSNRFGRRLYEMFFETYTEKVWGIPCTKIRADWAAQRIKGLSLRKAVTKALFGRSEETSLINEFHYPVLGPGMMWENVQERVEAAGGTVRLESEVVEVVHQGQRVTHLVIQDEERCYKVTGDYIINSMPITHLVERLRPAPPAPVRQAARGLAYRDFLIVALILDEPDVFPDNWIYVHSPEVRVGRIQNFKNWSPAMVPDPSMTCLGMEYFCSRGGDLWGRSEDELIALASQELEKIGLGEANRVVDGTVIRQPMAYPVYDGTYLGHLDVIREYLQEFENLQTVGRAGMHRYNNQDHSMLTAMLAVRNILGEEHDVWNVNVERSYHEEFTVEERAARQAA